MADIYTFGSVRTQRSSNAQGSADSQTYKGRRAEARRVATTTTAAAARNALRSSTKTRAAVGSDYFRRYAALTHRTSFRNCSRRASANGETGSRRSGMAFTYFKNRGRCGNIGFGSQSSRSQSCRADSYTVGPADFTTTSGCRRVVA